MSSTIRERLAWEVTPELYEKIRKEWIAHSKAEDARDIDGLMSTLSDNCVYEIIPTGQRWEGKAGATQFYLTFLGAFPDVHFDLQDIVIGPQGVIEVANMTGTHKGEWNGMAATGRKIELFVIIHFPWNPTAEKFDGEKVYFDSGAMQRQLSS
jgi:predicted ester cyclase